VKEKLNYQFSKLKHLLKDENMIKNAEGDVEFFLDELHSINNENMILSDSRKRIKKIISITQGEIFFMYYVVNGRQ
jgi:hypothetical protein